MAKRATSGKAGRDLAYYMALPYTYTVMPDEGGYVVKVNELNGCLSQGDTAEEALQRIREAQELWIEGALSDGMSVPEPLETDAFSGRFVVRVPKRLHAALAMAAESEKVSLNLFAATALARAVGLPPDQEPRRRRSVKGRTNG